MSTPPGPPRLQLSLPNHATSFKRSFHQFGFEDLDSPATALPNTIEIDRPPSGPSSSSADGDGNRRKRPRSASSLSEHEERSSEASSSTLSSESSSADSRLSHSSTSQPGGRRRLLLDLDHLGLGSSVALGLGIDSHELQLDAEPPRLPTLELLENEDVDMQFQDDEEELPSPAEHIRQSVDRFNTFDSHISVLRSSSPPVIPLPAELSHASLSPPTLPPLPHVTLGLDPEADHANDHNDENDDDHEHIPSVTATNTASTPPRLDLDLPPTSLSAEPHSPQPSTQFRERLDSAIDGLGTGNIDFEVPISDHRDDGPDATRHIFASGPTASTRSASTHRPRRLPAFEWNSSTPDDFSMTLDVPDRPPGIWDDETRSSQSPPLSPGPWRPHVRPPHVTSSTDRTNADIRRFAGRAYSPPPPPPPSLRLYPRPASLAAPLSVAATTSIQDAPGLGADPVSGSNYLDLHRSHSSSRAWESALDRARILRRERERERDRERLEFELQRERARERQREEEVEAEREHEHPWSLDSFWESSSASVRLRPWAPVTMRTRREVDVDEEIETELDLARRLRTRDWMRRRDEQLDSGESSFARATRYLESGLVDPRESSQPASLPSSAAARERRLRPPPASASASNPFSISWGPERGASGDALSRFRHSRSPSRPREFGADWLEDMDHDERDAERPGEWFSSEFSSSRHVNVRIHSANAVTDDGDVMYPRANGGEGSRGTGTWQPRLALSPQATVQPSRTATHARALSIPSASLSTSSTGSVHPSIHRLRSRLYGSGLPRSAGVGSSNSLVAENAAAIRRREARTELMERLNRTMSSDLDADSQSDWDRYMGSSSQPRRDSRHVQEHNRMDSDDDDAGIISRGSVEMVAAELENTLTAQLNRRRSRLGIDSSPPPQRLPSSRTLYSPPPINFDGDEPTASALNTRQPLSRRPIPHLRQHSSSGELSPPSSGVDRRHVSWEAPPREPGVSSTYEYLSALSHGLDSRASSSSDLAHASASASNADALRSPNSPAWTEAPSSTLFGRPFSATRSFSPAASSSGRDLPRRHDLVEDRGVPSLPPPDLGRTFVDRTEDILRSTSVDDGVNGESSDRSPSPSTNPYTGPFRLTMQRREEYSRRASQRRIPDPPSIPPLLFGGDSEHPPSLLPSAERSDTRHRLLAELTSQRPRNYQGPPSRSELSVSSRLADLERRFLHPTSSLPQSSDGDARRFFASRPTSSASTSHVEESEQSRIERRYTAADMHNVLARQARLEGSRLDLPSPYGGASQRDTDSVDLSHDGPFTSRAHLLISRFHEQMEAEERESSAPATSSSAGPSSSAWAPLPSRRAGAFRSELEARRRRLSNTRPQIFDPEPLQFRHRLPREPSFHALLGAGHPFHASARLRRGGLGDYMRDEDFDSSYESLLSLGGIIGDAKPKGTPEDVIAGLDAASYQDWATSDSDHRCPICLDDYQPLDPVLRLGDCQHWLHKECLIQWLNGANTCPVCRKGVKGKGKGKAHAHHHTHRRDRDGPGGPEGDRGLPSGWLDFLRE